MPVMDNMMLAAPDQPGEQFRNLILKPGAVRKREEEVREQAMELLGVFNLERLADHYAGTLSGGQRSRVSLAAALLGEPDLLVLDEPTVGLDPLLRVELWRLFGRLAAGGARLLVSSHSLEEARHCDDLLLMRDGEVLVEDSPAGVRRRTGHDNLEDAFVALVSEREAVPA